MIIICDGVEEAGKSTIVERVMKKYKNFEFCHFPSDKLIKKHYGSVIGKSTSESKLFFLKDLINEEEEFFEKNKDKNLIIDRMWISSLVYQGDGEYINNKDGEFNKKINKLYIDLFKRLNIPLKSIFHFVFLKSFDDMEFKRDISNLDKDENDKNNKMFKMKLRNLVNSKNNTNLFDCLQNFIVFDEEDDGNFISKKWTVERVDEIQNDRFYKISAIIEGN